MDFNQLQLISKQGESNTVEFKTSTAKLKSAFETICAFLNGKGGTVLIGVNGQGQLIGQDATDNTRREIAREINKIEPTTSVNVHYIKIKENKCVVAIDVDRGDHVPYIYDGRAFQRDESQTDRMSQHRYEQLLVKRGQLNHSWEEIIAPEYSINQLDHEEIYKTIADGIRENRIPASAQKEDIEQILERLNLTVGSELKRAAVVLYAKQESMKFVQCMIKLARFKGTNKSGDFIDNQQIYGNAFRLLSEADAFLRRHLPIASFFKPDQFKRIDKPALPVMAVREALINAICHRDYADRYTDISLAVYDDRLEIWNSGSLLRTLTLENLKYKHESILRNKYIANAFYVRGWIEKWGSGTNKMVDLCREEDIPEPVFEEDTGGLRLIFRFREPISTAEKINKLTMRDKINTRQELILNFIKETKITTIQQILNHLALNLVHAPTKKTIVRDLNYLKSKGLIGLEGEGKSAAWIFCGMSDS